MLKAYSVIYSVIYPPKLCHHAYSVKLCLVNKITQLGSTVFSGTIGTHVLTCHLMSCVSCCRSLCKDNLKQMAGGTLLKPSFSAQGSIPALLHDCIALLLSHSWMRYLLFWLQEPLIFQTRKVDIKIIHICVVMCVCVFNFFAFSIYLVNDDDDSVMRFYWKKVQMWKFDMYVLDTIHYRRFWAKNPGLKEGKAQYKMLKKAWLAWITPLFEYSFSTFFCYSGQNNSMGQMWLPLT